MNSFFFFLFFKAILVRNLRDWIRRVATICNWLPCVCSTIFRKNIIAESLMVELLGKRLKENPFFFLIKQLNIGNSKI